MVQIKLFGPHNDSKKIEEEANDWLKNHAMTKIRSVKMNRVVAPTTAHLNTILVVYEI